MCKKDLDNIVCPHCKSNNIWHFGSYRGRDRYRCKDCLKTFTESTNKPWSYSKKSKETWNEYIRLMMNSATLRKCASKLNITLTTAFNWRHKLMNSIEDKYGNPKLEEVVSIMKSNIKENRKGQRNICTEAKLFNITYAIDTNEHFLIDLFEGHIKISMYDELFEKYVSKDAKILRTNNQIINHSSEKFNKEKVEEKGVGVFYKYRDYKSWLKSFKGIATKYIIKYHHYFRKLYKLYNEIGSPICLMGI